MEKIINSYEEYRNLKEKILSIYPFFDFGAKDAARFFFGTSDPKVEWMDGDLNILQFIDEDKFAKMNDQIVIEEGGRNTYLLILLVDYLLDLVMLKNRITLLLKQMKKDVFHRLKKVN